MDADGTTSLSPGVVVSRSGQVDDRRVDVRKAVQDQSRLVGDDGTPSRPGDGERQVVILGSGKYRYPVDATGHVLEPTSAGEQP